MDKKIKKFVLCLFFYAFFLVTSSIVSAEFKTYWPGKEVHLSSSTSKFFKKMIPKFQRLLNLKSKFLKAENNELVTAEKQIFDMLICFSKTNPICGQDIENLGQFIFKARAPLIIAVKSGSISKKSNQQQLLTKEIGTDLDQAFKEVYIGTAKADLQEIRKFLKNPTHDQVIYVYGLIQEIIRLFDGVAITEYDFIVLCQAALLVLMIAD